MQNYKESSTSELVWMLGTRFRDYRIRLGLTQKEVAEIAGLSEITVCRFENGTTRAVSLNVFLLMLKSIGMIDNIDKLLPDLPIDPYRYRDDFTRIQRVRHKKNE